jgi:hypothetical protein
VVSLFNIADFYKIVQMFNEKNYDMAIVCFERAMYSHSNMAKWAKAASLQQSGQRLLELDAEAAKTKLREAAECFLSIEKPDLAANCFIIMGDYEEAGKCTLPNGEFQNYSVLQL